MSLIAWFNELPDQNLGLIAGGKGASLCRMFQNGFPVPEGFICCSDMFSTFMEVNKLWDKVYEKIDGINWDSDESLAQAGESIRTMVAEAPMPEDMAKTLIEHYIALGDNVPVAVRSSGTAEDLDDASFAGQQETYLYVIGKDEVVKFVRECWASLYNDCALFYRREKKFDERDISIAVVVMRMVNSEKSGVMFSANPINKCREACMIEAAWGLGEGVVQGIVNPDNYVVNKADYSYNLHYVAEKEIMVIRASERGGSKEVPVPDDIKSAPVLSDAEVQELVNLAIKVEAFYSKPQDLEWAYEKGNMYLLQSRPITTL
jgi:pyruvate, water dikinase